MFIVSRNKEPPRRRCRGFSALRLAALVPLAFASQPVTSEPLWLSDPVSGCRIWAGDDPAAVDDIVSWSGNCHDGTAAGQGVLSWFADGALLGRYEGEMLDGRLEGRGRLAYRLEDGFGVLVGDFEDGLPHGKVSLRYANGDRFRGVVQNGIDTGRGVYVTAEGAKLNGSFRDGIIEGEVVSESPDGEVFRGTFRNSERETGVVIYPDGTRYEGPFASGEPSGTGILELPDGGVYEGTFSGGEPNGNGVFTAANGDVYRGTFANGYPEGEMEVTLAQGGVERQTWAGGKRTEP